MAQWLVSVNRAAGSRAVSVDDVADALHVADVDARLVVPNTAAETTAVLQDAAREGQTHFAVVGGDGTANLAVNALLSLDWDVAPVLGILPSGTGCDLLRTFG
ncbi:MAG: acylglycerol kinase family protein, partial [Acidimicrobiia bacterium]